MAYLLGNETCIESLQKDVEDLQWTVKEIISRIGPIPAQSWKFPDKIACDVDVRDLLDLYSCDDQDDVEDRQVAHIALYELVIDRLVLILQSLSIFIERYMNCGGKGPHDDGENKLSSSVGIAAKQHWLNMNKLNTLVQHLQSENRSKTNKVSELEQEKNNPESNHFMPVTVNSEHKQSNSVLHTPGTLGVIPPNNADLVLMGLSPPPLKKLSISQDMSHKSCQTLETAFVPCESCDIIQRKMREGGDLVIKSCTDQGLPCSLKKFKNQVNHVEMLTFNDICRWMTEQNKDIGRIVKQSELLQSMVDPIKLELKEAGSKVKVADEKLRLSEKKLAEVKENSNIMYANLEKKITDQESKHLELLSEEKKSKEMLLQQKELVDRELSEAKIQIDQQMKAMNKLETEFKNLEYQLENKIKEADRVGQLTEEMVELKTQLADVTAQMTGYQKALAKEQGKSRSLSKHNESLQAKQEALLSRMDLLGQNNDTFASQLASLEEERNNLDNKLTELTVETKELKKKLKENEVILKNLEKEKKSLKKSLQESLATVGGLKTQLEEAKERERMIVEYPDLNGPVNRDYQGSGDIAQDMKNQITANQVRIKVLQSQNDTLSESVKKITSLQKEPEHDSNREHNSSSSAPLKPQPLWKQDSSFLNINTNNAHKINYNDLNSHRDHVDNSKIHRGSSRQDLPKGGNFAWETPTSQAKETDYGSEFIIGHGFSDARQHSPVKDTSSMRPPSGKLTSVMAPVNATPIGAYTQMKKSLGMLSEIGKVKKGRPTSASLRSHGHAPSLQVDQPRRKSSDLPFSCPRCDKMYGLLRDLEIHKTYCTQ
ncbi:hypothetical protein Btru_000832 [Bulinus truncatus]|nr:hypothetical protein Btru_000832 [Bulinus truncatus]